MTRKSVVARDAKRQKMVDRYASKRAALKEADVEETATEGATTEAAE